MLRENTIINLYSYCILIATFYKRTYVYYSCTMHTCCLSEIIEQRYLGYRYGQETGYIFRFCSGFGLDMNFEISKNFWWLRRNFSLQNYKQDETKFTFEPRRLGEIIVSRNPLHSSSAHTSVCHAREHPDVVWAVLYTRWSLSLLISNAHGTEAYILLLLLFMLDLTSFKIDPQPRGQSGGNSTRCAILGPAPFTLWSPDTF